ncbi:MAG: DUF4148 domain-containing protein [Pararobbsia sp.]
MNKLAIKKLAIAAVALLSAASVTSAFALSSVKSQLAQDNAPTMEKTRAQVQAELVQAEEAGVLPTSQHNYPNIDPAVKKANQYRFASAERWWGSNTNTTAQ